MTFYGIPQDKLQAIARGLDLEIDTPRKDGKGLSFRVLPLNSDHKYARRSGSGRRVKACSYEAFRDFILSAFANGCTAIRTIHPTLRKHTRMTETEFRDLLESFRYYNIGSRMYPAYMVDLSNEAVPETILNLP